ncbi:unnamed protein product [Didymodactylos carnosus]|uniref:HAT C-terminal dimerisation domain-containing protein n=1 Tax=Didymodactylos carnosus TaxID=1234261 RepID=A0A815RX70_9BILA|nr:unnamed protein product [Didymodactylos carnosus]CAF1481985.1 unnamed protein product [Didymodactylos carnosus]CAF3710016.1 unnamed protein product [Didymodactylos carnosus]CAF4346923.1 unnamed protein product [Didymodactylos carnosus]
MFVLDDLHWIAVLNSRTRMLKLATDAERAHAHGLVRSELAKIIETERAEDNRSVESPVIVNPSPQKKFKSYTTQFDDEVEYNEPGKKLTISVRAQREMETYLQMKLSRTTTLNNDNENPLLFWKEQEKLLPNMSKLSRKIFSIPASSTAVERAFSSADVVISQRRTNISPSTVNDIILIRSSTNRSKKNI